MVTIAASGPGGSGTGSGEVIRPDGYILTNSHVIAVAAASEGSVEVLFSAGQTASAAITGRDPQTDLAVLKVQSSRELKVISLGWCQRCRRTLRSTQATAAALWSTARVSWWGCRRPATSNLQLEELTLTKKPGATVSIGYTRDGRSATATVTLAAQP